MPSGEVVDVSPRETIKPYGDTGAITFQTESPYWKERKQIRNARHIRKNSNLLKIFAVFGTPILVTTKQIKTRNAHQKTLSICIFPPWKL